MVAHVRPEQVLFPFEDLARCYGRGLNWWRWRTVVNSGAEQIHLASCACPLPFLCRRYRSVQGRQNSSAVAQLVESASLGEGLHRTSIDNRPVDCVTKRAKCRE